MHPLKAVGHRSLAIFGSYGFENFFQPRQGRADVTNFQRKLDFPVILQKIFYILTLHSGLPNSALQVGIGQIGEFIIKKLIVFALFQLTFDHGASDTSI